MAEAWNNLAVSYYMRRYAIENAIRTYQRAISLNPGSASFHNNLAAAYMDSTSSLNSALPSIARHLTWIPMFFEHASQNGISAHMGSPQDRAQFSLLWRGCLPAPETLIAPCTFCARAMEDGYPKIDDVYHDKEFAQAMNDERFLALMKDRPVAVQ